MAAMVTRWNNWLCDTVISSKRYHMWCACFVPISLNYFGWIFLTSLLCIVLYTCIDCTVLTKGISDTKQTKWDEWYKIADYLMEMELHERLPRSMSPWHRYKEYKLHIPYRIHDILPLQRRWYPRMLSQSFNTKTLIFHYWHSNLPLLRLNNSSHTIRHRILLGGVLLWIHKACLWIPPLN